MNILRYVTELEQQQSIKNDHSTEIEGNLSSKNLSNCF
jgi:hypothetical protein